MENSKIEWTDHTFNPWHGCMKVSAGCKNCYAEVQDKRWGHSHWGPDSERKPMSDNYWRQPIKWNAEAEKSCKSVRVFCASMADVFEDHPQTLEHLDRLFQIIEYTPFLIWQLLTKRPENIMKLIPRRWTGKLPFDWMPQNVWIGTSVEDQAEADARIPHLLKVPAAVRFLSCEPLLGPLDLSEFIRSGIHWVIAGGESGPHARPMHPDWARSLRDQCHNTSTAFFFKQWGEYWPGEFGRLYRERTLDFTDGQPMVKIGKKDAGRLLDGRTHDEFPQPQNTL